MSYSPIWQVNRKLILSINSTYFLKITISLIISDLRTNEKYLIPNPIPLGCIALLYALFVLWIGPRLMEGRKQNKLWKLYFLYNLAMVILNVKLFHKVRENLYLIWRRKKTCKFFFFLQGLQYWLYDFDSMCAPLSRIRTDESIEVANYVYFHFIVKVVELLHTVS